MAKKKNKSKSNGLNVNEKSVKAVLSLFILLLAFGVLLIFNTYQKNILSSFSFQMFVALAVILFAFLAGLLFLVNPQKNKR